MVGISDEEMEKLLTLADQISDDYVTGMNDLETLKSNYNSEISNRQSIEVTCSNLTQENERLKKLQNETLNNLLLQLQRSGECKDSKEELKRLNLEIVKKEEEYQIELKLMRKIYEDKIRVLEGEIGEVAKLNREKLRNLSDEFVKKEEDYRNSVEKMKKNYEEKIRVLELKIGEILGQKREDEATMYQLHHELISTRKISKEMELKCKEEIDDLKDCVCVEQQEKEELSKKVRDLEKELLVTRTRMADQHVSTSDKQLEMMKQKMMKLRRENEVLRRQVNISKEG